MDISQIRDELTNSVNNIVDEYSKIVKTKFDDIENLTRDFSFVNNENTSLKSQLSERENEIRDLKKKCHEYEQIINTQGERITEMEEEQLCNDKVSIVKLQAKSLGEKDVHIERLETKIKQLTEKPSIKPVISEPKTTPKINNKTEFDDNGDLVIQLQEPQQETTKPESSEEEDIQLKSVKYKGERYYIIVGEDPQYVYNIKDEGELGEKRGMRTPKSKGKGYDYDFTIGNETNI
tara:strand:- start:20 stop:724 length:705 start_codon:yes stop_codon:yes gene_type:complete